MLQGRLFRRSYSVQKIRSTEDQCGVRKKQARIVRKTLRDHTKLFKPSATRSHRTLVIKNYPDMLFSSQKKSNPNLISTETQSPSSANSKSYKTLSVKNSRVQSLENLMKKCLKVRDELKSSTLADSQTFTDHISSLKRSINRIHRTANPNLLHSESLLRSDSNLLRQQLSYAEKLRHQTKTIWKFSSRSLKKSTSRLMDSVRVKFNLKHLH